MFNLLSEDKLNADRESLEIDNKDDFFQFIPVNFFFQISC